MPTITRPRVLRAAAFTAAASLIASGLVVLGGGFATAFDGAVSGTVFRDFNSNGQYDTGNAASSGIPNDVPLPGVTVSVYDEYNNRIAEVVSGVDGEYTAATGMDNGIPVRVEFTDLPEGYYPTFSSDAPGLANGTSVQFVDVGAESVDFGANLPDDYNQGSTWTAVPVHVQGDPALHPDEASIKVVPAVNPGTDDAARAAYEPPVVATQGQTGALWGTAWDGADRTLYTSAVYKRQSGLGALGIGGIYRLPGLLDDGNEIVPGTPVEAWLDVEDLTVVGTGEQVEVGDVPTNGERGLNGHSAPAVDEHAYANAGKLGILGIAISVDGDTLYFLNALDRNLYAVDISDPDVKPTQATRIPLNLPDGVRPWAVETRNGQIYVGYVETGEDLPPGSTAAEGDLSFTVVSTPMASPGVWTPVLIAPLDYPRQPGSWFGVAPAANRWNSWVDVWSWDQTRNGVRSVAVVKPTSPGTDYYMQVFPQAVLSDIAFDRDGYMVVTLMDRVAMQGGLRNFPLDNDQDPRPVYIARTVSDVLVAAPGAAGWELENDGRVGDRVASDPDDNAGPGGGEFLNDLALRHASFERESAFGSATVLPGTTALAVAGSDVWVPASNGVQWFDLENGTPSETNRVTVSTNFSKAPGLGGMDDLALAAPVQIGDRVWFDADQNGRQDADEPGVGGVGVQLLDAEGTVLSQTTTDSEGGYLFSSTNIAGFVPGAEYTVRFVLPGNGGDLPIDEDLFGSVPWTAVDFTTQFSDEATTLSDSNAGADGQTPLFLVGGPGQNDHTIDAGLIANAEFDVHKVIADGSDPALPGETFTILVSAKDFRGDTYQLPGDGVYEVEAGGSQLVSVPAGTRVTVTEDDSGPRIEDYTVQPSGEILVEGDGATRTIVTVTNRLARILGTFEIVKEISGTGTSPVGDGDVFTAEWATDPDGPWTTIEFTTAGPVGPGVDFQDGTLIYLRELTPPDLEGVEWGTPTYSGATVVDGIAQFEIEGGNDPVVITIDNPTTGLGGFEVTKSVAGEGAPLVQDQEFTVEYTTTDDQHPQGQLTVKAGETVGLDELEVGTEVTLSEVTPNGPAWIDWGTPVFSGNGVTVHPDGSATFSIDEVGTVQIGLENHATPVTTQVQLQKSVVGGGASVVPANTGFSVQYGWVAGSRTGEGEVTVRQDQPVTLTDVPRGATLTLHEVNLPSVDGVSWGQITWTGPGVEDNRNGSASVVVGGDQLIELQLENTPELLQSGFSLSKVVTGSGADHLPDDILFEIQYELDGEPQAPLFVGPSQPLAIDDIDHGAEVTLTEVNLPALPYIQWGTSVWTVDGVEQDGQPVTFTIDASRPVVTLSLENTATLLEGTFEISKEVTGPGSGSFDDDMVFSGTYEWAGGEGEFEVKAGETWTLDEPLPAGTEVTISEIAPVGGLPDGYNWGTPMYRVGGGDPVAGPVTITIGNDTTVGVAIENPTTINSGRFTITKRVLGEDVVQSDFQFTGTYTHEGLSEPVEFTVQKDGTFTSPDLPMGTVVTITEITPAGGLPDGYGWGTPQFIVDGEFVGESAQITIGNETTIAIELRNPVTHPQTDIEKGDGLGDTIEHDADTVDESEVYAPGETRTIVIRVQNTGDEELQNVGLTDSTWSGADIQSLVWEFPDGSSTEAAFAAGVWTAQWEETFGAGATQSWAPGDWITGTATLTVSDGSVPHADNAVVDAVGRFSGVPVRDEDRYYAFTAAIQLIKYDGEKPDPAVKDGDDWITPVKPMDDPFQDANDEEHAVKYPISTPQRVRMVATNTGHTWLTEVNVTDVTDFGEYDVQNIVADLSPIGGPDSWSFAEQGPWVGPWEPGTSFFLEGDLTLPADTRHTDTATITAIVVHPAVDADGKPTGEPAMENGVPVQALDENGEPWTLWDSDPFNAYTGSQPPLPNTGAGVQPWPLALLLLATGVALLAATRLTVDARRRGRHRIEPAA